MTTRRATADRKLPIASAAALIALACAGLAFAQTPPAPAASQARPPAAALPAAHPASAARTKPAVASRPGPTWRELPAGQQQALAPLAAHWDTLNESQKRKWIAMSANFPKMSGEEQAKLHSRMTEWASLSPQQRTIARLNYGETKKLSADDKKAKWDAYQALSPEEKKKLAAKAASPKPPTTAAAVRPVPREKLAVLPKARPNLENKAPRIAAAPNQVDHRTLLPQPTEPRVQPQAQPAVLAQPQPQPQPPAPPAHPLPPQAGTPD